jgi:hypothetical protein
MIMVPSIKTVQRLTFSIKSFLLLPHQDTIPACPERDGYSGPVKVLKLLLP